MAERFLLAALTKSNREEGFAATSPPPPPPAAAGAPGPAPPVQVGGTFKVVLLVLFYSLWVLIGSFAAYLSWTANSLVGWHTVFKVLFSLFAFLFPASYLFVHLVHRYDLILHIRRLTA